MDLPTNPCVLQGEAPGGAAWFLSISRWKGALHLRTGARTEGREAEISASLAAAGARTHFDPEAGWAFESEADARRAAVGLVGIWSDLRSLQLTFAPPGRREPWEFWLRWRSNEPLVEVTPALEYHRDEQRARVPAAEEWLAGVLAAPEFQARADWTAQWVVPPGGALALLAGPLDPFVR